MYAIIEDSGQQFKVEEGQEIDIDFREIQSGAELKFDRVLAYRNGEVFKFGEPLLASAAVTARVHQAT